jgi:hypothetical protein
VGEVGGIEDAAAGLADGVGAAVVDIGGGVQADSGVPVLMGVPADRAPPRLGRCGPGVEQVPALGLAHPSGVLVGLRDRRVQQRAVQGHDGAFGPGNRPQTEHLADGV